MKIAPPALSAASPATIPAAAATPPAANPEAQQAAQQFEAMMLKQILAQAMPKMPGLGQNWVDLALDDVAGELSRGMPLGLARLLESEK